MRTDFGELMSELKDTDAGATRALGTAEWMTAGDSRKQLSFPLGTPSEALWIGEALDGHGTPLGYADDRHVCLVSGTRGGKGAGVIMPNLCLWPGSALVIDPKGENATVSARRRGQGSEYAKGLGQKVCILDPFGEVQLDDSLKMRFNPLDVIDPKGDLAVDDAGRLAASIVLRESKNDPFWEEAARNLVKGLILHVLSDVDFQDSCNLVSVRNLLTRGDWIGMEALKAEGGEPPKSAFLMLWQTLKLNKAFDGTVAAVGEQMASMADKTRSGILEIARTNTVFIDGAPMRRQLEKSDFELAELKTNPTGLTIYLTLPQRYMETHYRWLRLMVSLAVGEMERIKGRPQTGFPTLFLLDEFAGLRRMEVIEHAVAQAAGFGVKFFFVVQNLPQLKREYEDAWETFVSNSGAKIFFQIDDQFTRDYLSHLLGEQEVRRDSRSGSRAETASQSTTDGESTTVNTSLSVSDSSGESVSRSFADWQLTGRQRGLNRGTGSSSTEGDATGTSFSRTGSLSASTTDGWSEAVHKRPLLHPDEIGRFLARIDDQAHPAYPGLVVCLTPGRHPLIARRTNYFSSQRFAGLFDPHPNHPRPPTLTELAQRPPPAAPTVAQDMAQAPQPPSPPKPSTLATAIRGTVTGLKDMAQPDTAPRKAFEAGFKVAVVAGSAGIGLAGRAIAAARTTIIPPGTTTNVRPGGASAADLLQHVVADSEGAAQVLPKRRIIPPRTPQLVKPAPVRQPGRGRRLSFGSLLPALIIGGGLWVFIDKTDPDAIMNFLRAVPGAASVSTIAAGTQNVPAAYRDGKTDRATWEKWFNSLSGNTRDGADFWAGQRSLAQPGSCNDGRGQASAAFRQGCIWAQQYLTPTDRRRRSEPDYRRGWNDY